MTRVRFADSLAVGGVNGNRLPFVIADERGKKGEAVSVSRNVLAETLPWR